MKPEPDTLAEIKKMFDRAGIGAAISPRCSYVVADIEWKGSTPSYFSTIEKANACLAHYGLDGDK